MTLSENKPEFENTGKKNQQVSEQSEMDLRENTKELPILSNFYEQHGSLFAVNSSSVMYYRDAENKYVEYVPMIGACSYPYNLAPNKDSIPQVNAGNEKAEMKVWVFKLKKQKSLRMKFC